MQALDHVKKQRIVPFDVPGTTRGAESRADRFFWRKMHERRRQFHEDARQPVPPHDRHRRGGSAAARPSARIMLFLWWAGRRRRCRRWSCPSVKRGQAYPAAQRAHERYQRAHPVRRDARLYKPRTDKTLGIALGCRSPTWKRPSWITRMRKPSLSTTPRITASARTSDHHRHRAPARHEGPCRRAHAPIFILARTCPYRPWRQAQIWPPSHAQIRPP